MLAGSVVLRRELRTAGGVAVRAAVIRPEPTAENVAALREVDNEWGDQADTIRGERAQRRAYFASAAAFDAAAVLANRHCCVLVVQDEDTGEVLGLMKYRRNGGSWWLDDVTVAPRHQTEQLNQDRLRGIGSAMLAVAAADIAADPGCSRVQLFTLDEQAERFWRRRGFHNTHEPLHMDCPEVRELAHKLAPEDRPDLDDVPFACNYDRWWECEKPTRRQLVR